MQEQSVTVWPEDGNNALRSKIQSVRRLRFTRSHIVVRLKRRLERDSFPRFQMGFIVSLTGAAGLLCSFLLLRAGVESMALRYPTALLAAYLFFLLLLWLWLRTRASDYVDSLDPTNIDPGSGSVSAPESFTSGGGGDFAGGGASGSFGPPDASSVADTACSPDVDLDVGELALPILAVVLALGLAVASLYVVYIAPELFAELLFDGVLSYTLYRHLTVGRGGNWLGTAIRRTLLPFGLTAVFLGAVGAAMAHYVPEARSIGQVIHHASNRH